MNMNEEFINVYIEMNNKKIEELIRSELFLQTRLSMAEKMITQLNDEKKVLQDKIDELIVEKETVPFFENKKPAKKDKDPESSVL